MSLLPIDANNQIQQSATPLLEKDLHANLGTIVSSLEEFEKSGLIIPEKAGDFTINLNILRKPDSNSPAALRAALNYIKTAISTDQANNFKIKSFRDYGLKLIISTLVTAAAIAGIGVAFYYGGPAIAGAVAGISLGVGAATGITFGGMALGALGVGLFNRFKQSIYSFLGGVWDVLKSNLIEPWKCLRDDLTNRNYGYVNRVSESLGLSVPGSSEPNLNPNLFVLAFAQIAAKEAATTKPAALPSTMPLEDIATVTLENEPEPKATPTPPLPTVEQRQAEAQVTSTTPVSTPVIIRPLSARAGSKSNLRPSSSSGTPPLPRRPAFTKPAGTSNPADKQTNNPNTPHTPHGPGRGHSGDTV